MIKLFYEIILSKNKLIITCYISNQKSYQWYFDEGWGEDVNTVRKIQPLKNKIIVSYDLSEIPIHHDDRDFSYPFCRDNYFMFHGSIGLPLLSIDEKKDMDVSFDSNLPLYVSGIGHVDKTKNYILSMSQIKSQMYVGTNVCTNYKINNSVDIYFTMYEKSYMFIEIDKIINAVKKFLKRCYSFFDINENTTFVVNYIGDKLHKNITSTGHGGFGSRSGFSYFIMFHSKKEISKSKIIDVIIHELYHHFNKSSGMYDTMWFSEGFTEFFSRFLRLEPNKLKYVSNDFIVKYNQNPYAETSVSEHTKENFWTNRYYEKLAYTKGYVYALFLFQIYGKQFIDNYKKIIKDFYEGKINIDNKTLKKYLDDKYFDMYIIDGKRIKLVTKKIKDVNKIVIDSKLQKIIYSKVDYINFDIEKHIITIKINDAIHKYNLRSTEKMSINIL